MKIQLIIITILLTLMSCKDDDNSSSNIKNNKNTNFASGIYLSLVDHDHTIEIRENKYYMHYKGMATKEDSIYNIMLIDVLPNYPKGKYLKLVNGDDIMEYEIVSWDSENISLTYLPRGNTLNYKKNAAPK